MDYTICMTEQVYSGEKVSINHNGNRYTVCYMVPNEDGTHEYTTKTFKNIGEALNVYQKLIGWFVLGLYSVQQRKELLK